MSDGGPSTTAVLLPEALLVVLMMPEGDGQNDYTAFLAELCNNQVRSEVQLLVS
jgi:hypothetical protein